MIVYAYGECGIYLANYCGWESFCLNYSIGALIESIKKHLHQLPIYEAYDDEGREYIPLFLHGSLPGTILSGP